MKKEFNEISPNLLLQMNAFVSEKDVLKMTSLSRTSIHRKRLAGEFPEPQEISDGRVGYRIRDIHAWLKDPKRWPQNAREDNPDTLETS